MLATQCHCKKYYKVSSVDDGNNDDDKNCLKVFINTATFL